MKQSSLSNFFAGNGSKLNGNLKNNDKLIASPSRAMASSDNSNSSNKIPLVSGSITKKRKADEITPENINPNSRQSATNISANSQNNQLSNESASVIRSPMVSFQQDEDTSRNGSQDSSNPILKKMKSNEHVFNISKKELEDLLYMPSNLLSTQETTKIPWIDYDSTSLQEKTKISLISNDVITLKEPPKSPLIHNFTNSIKETTKSPLIQNGNTIPKVKDRSTLHPLNDKKFNAYHDAPYYEGQSIPFSLVVECFNYVATIKGEHSKDHIKEVLANMYRTAILLKPDELIDLYYFTTKRMAPDFESNETGIGPETLVKVIGKTTGKTRKQITDSFTLLGDLGSVAAQSKATQSTMDKFFKKSDDKKKAGLTVKKVMDTFKNIESTKGMNSAQEKESQLLNILFDATQEEAKYIVRWIQRHFQIGAATLTMQAALVRAFVIAHYTDEKNNGKTDIIDFEGKVKRYELTVKQAMAEFPDDRVVLSSLLKIGKDIDSLSNYCKVTPGTPVKPMLAHPTNEIALIFKRFAGIKFSCEYKYDGLRGQIHYTDGRCQLFSRNLENMTEMYPDVVEFIMGHIKPHVTNFIIDSEVVAVDPKTEKILPFQTLSNRARKNVNLHSIDIKVCLYVFDIIYRDNKSLLNETLGARREILRDTIEESGEKLKYVKHIDTESFEDIEEFMNQSIKDGCEGLMVKSLDETSIYQPSKRSLKWLKLKKDYLESGLCDRFDLVPIAAYYGTGKRVGLFGSYLMACYNEEMERYETLCKMAYGYTDENLLTFTKFYQERIIPAPLEEYKLKDIPVDVWLEPCQVWEVKGADLQISPVHTAAIGEIDSNKGIGLRFPRFSRTREDKKPYEATASQMVADNYRNQATVINKMKIKEEEDFY
jgi:DNA ligase-1